MYKTIFLFLLAISCAIEKPVAQTYIGEVLYRNTYEYIKIKCQDNSCEFSIPYLDGDRKYKTQRQPEKDTHWEVLRGIEKWKFNTAFKNGTLNGELELPTGQQRVLFRQQGDPLSKAAQPTFIGVFEDKFQRKAIVYSRFDYLHIMSPYSEETMSLKPIGKNTFWSVSGEQSVFSNLQEDKFQTLKIVDRFGNQNTLSRTAAVKIETLWIPVGEDTLYAQLYMPQSKTKVPACLVLPGGGATGIDNYEYEARYFAAYGIASLIFDKPGNGKSKGSNNFVLQTFEEKNDQYKILFKYLQNHPRVDPEKVGIHGPSEGGRLALMMAIDLKKEVAFVNATAAPIMTFREGQFYAMDQLHRNMGIDEIDNMKIQQIWSDYYDGIVKGEIDSEIIDRANIFRQQNQRLFLPPDFTQIPGAPTKQDIPHNRVVKEAEKISCPVFLQYGENDQRVNGHKSLQNFLSKISNKELINTKIYHRGNHSFMTPEYKICPGYTDDKINWLKTIGIL